MISITSVVFDLDGTLVDSVTDLARSLNTVLKARGWPSLDVREVATIVGDGASVLVQRAVALTAPAGRDVAAEAAQLTPSFLAHYESHALANTAPYPGVLDTLALLRDAGFHLGVCTNKPERATRSILEHLGLAGFFGSVIGGDSLDGVRKPDPRPLAKVIAELGGLPGSAVMVGDSANDVACARALRIPIIVRSGGYGPIASEDLGADIVIHEFAELPDAIRRLP